MSRLSFILLLFITLVLPFIAQSQPIFSPGIIITAQGDSLHGSISEFSGEKNYSECIFRSSDQSKNQRFTPQDIRGYIIENRRYFISKQIPGSESESSHYFVEWIVQSKTSLVKVKKQFFLLEGNDSLQIIPTDKFLRGGAISREDVSVERAILMRFLNNLALDCPDLKEYFKNSRNLNVREDNLIEIVKMYNHCQGATFVEYGSELPFVAVNIGASITLDYTNLDFATNPRGNNRPLSEMDFSSIAPGFGMPVLLRSPRRLSNFSLYLEPSIRSFHFDRDLVVTPATAADQAYYDVSLSWLSLGTPFAIRYTLPNLRPLISLQAGPILQFHLRKESTMVIEWADERDGKYYYTTQRVTPFDLTSYQFGFGGQLNIGNDWNFLSRRWELAVGWQRGNGISEADVRLANETDPVLSSTNTFFLKCIWWW